MTTKTFASIVRLYEFQGEQTIGIDMPFELLEDMDLQENEVLSWEIDTNTKEVTIKKQNIILTQV